jgi:hypothetical protein
VWVRTLLTKRNNLSSAWVQLSPRILFLDLMNCRRALGSARSVAELRLLFGPSYDLLQLFSAKATIALSFNKTRSGLVAVGPPRFATSKDEPGTGIYRQSTEPHVTKEAMLRRATKWRAPTDLASENRANRYHGEQIFEHRILNSACAKRSEGCLASLSLLQEYQWLSVTGISDRLDPSLLQAFIRANNDFANSCRSRRRTACF